MVIGGRFVLSDLTSTGSRQGRIMFRPDRLADAPRHRPTHGADGGRPYLGTAEVPAVRNAPVCSSSNTNVVRELTAGPDCAFADDISTAVGGRLR